MIIFPVVHLREWFLKERRVLPWRENPSPYRVWVSEVMLQQTQVSVVIPYFERWMQRFPTIKELASASLSEVIKCWEGLGYYSRARNLHQAAQFLAEHFQGELPSNPSALTRLKGIGSYTQGAILSFAFHQKAAAVDGNVLRVVSRILALEDEIDRPKTQEKIKAYVESILPDEEPWVVMEGLIELGATVCMKKPRCMLCPLKPDCLAYRHQMQELLPKKKNKIKATLLSRDVALVRNRGKILLCFNQEDGVMQDLYEFPYLEHFKEDVLKRFEESLGLSLQYLGALKRELHTFTRFRATLFPHLFDLVEPQTGLETHLVWKAAEELEEIPLSSGHRRVWNQAKGKFA